MKIDKYFLCHYTKLSDRKEDVNNQLKNHSIEPEWILDYDQESIDFETIGEIYSNILSEKFLGRRLRNSEISLILKHEECLRRIVENNYRNSVIFEDDIVLCNDFVNKLDVYTLQLPQDYDLLWIGTCCNLQHSPIEHKKFVYQNMRGSRCTHAFLISLECAKKILKEMKYVYFPSDFFYNKMIKDFTLKSFWAEPALVTQNKNYKSSVQV